MMDYDHAGSREITVVLREESRNDQTVLVVRVDVELIGGAIGRVVGERGPGLAAVGAPGRADLSSTIGVGVVEGIEIRRVVGELDE
jgi:hypothetical protein